MAPHGSLEVFELIANDDTTESYLARLRGDTWIVLRRGRNDAATAAIEDVASRAIAIDDAHVVRTYDPGDALAQLRGTVLLEEYVEGDRLESWLVTLEQKPLPWRVAAAIVRDAALGAFAIQTACGPGAASALWPGRIAIGFDGSVKLVDPCAELRGAVLGDATRERYAAPELALGTETPAAAVYSLGRILLDLRGTGGPPPAYERIVARATAESPTDRFRNPSELAVALDALLDDPKPIEAYFDDRFAHERAKHAASLAILSDGTKTLETIAPSNPPPSMESGFTDEIKTAVMHRDSAPRLAPERVPVAEPSGPETVEELPDFEETSDTEELRLDSILGSYAADADEDIRTRPFRRQLIAKLKRSEHEVLGKGAERVTVIGTPVQPARTDSRTPDENVIIDPPPSATEIMQRSALLHSEDDETPLMPPISSEHEEAPMIDTATVDAALAVAAHAPKPKQRTFEEPPPNSGETVMMRAVQVPARSRVRDVAIIVLAAVLVAAVAFFVFR